MKYKVGDRVKMIFPNFSLSSCGRKEFEELEPPYVCTIDRVVFQDGERPTLYSIEEFIVVFPESYIEYLYERPTPIESRFEILDL